MGERLFGIPKEEDNAIMLCHMGILATPLRSEKVQAKLHQSLAKPLLTKHCSALLTQLCLLQRIFSVFVHSY